MKLENLPTFKKDGNPLERFIYRYEPHNVNEQDHFRITLVEALNFVSKHDEIMAAFMHMANFNLKHGLSIIKEREFIREFLRVTGQAKATNHVCDPFCEICKHSEEPTYYSEKA